MEIEYTNISYEKYNRLFEEESKKPYCVEYDNGIKDWKVNGKYHREDGPAVEYDDDGDKFWFLNDVEYSFEEWLEKTPISDEEKILLKLKYS